MSAAGFAMALGLLALVVIVALFATIWWAEGQPEAPEPVEHEEREP